MPLSNPTSRAECTSAAAAAATGGRAIFSSGSPFESQRVDGRYMHANQGNNFYVFPGLGLGSILVGSDHISDGMLNAAAEAIRGRWTPTRSRGARFTPGYPRSGTSPSRWRAR